MRSEDDIEAGDEDIAPGTRLDTFIPLVANPDLGAHRLNSYGKLRAESIDTISCASNGERKVGTAIVANLPESVSGQTHLQYTSQPGHTHASLDLNGIASCNVDITLAKIE